jgi:sodium transport system permease protein
MSDAESAVREQRLRAVLAVPDDAATLVNNGAMTTITIVNDSSNEKSRTAKSRLEQVLKKLGKTEIERRLEAKGLSSKSIEPFATKSNDVASVEKKSGSALAMILPYILCLTAAMGGMTSAFDLCAGEKERGTMETLLVSPASRSEIILGKLGTIGIVSIVATICSVAGLSLAAFAAVQLGRDAGITLQVSYASISALIVMVIPMVLMTSSLMLLISAFSRNQKEAQAYAFPFVMLVITPAVFSSILGPENGIGLALVPVLNTALAMKQVLSGIFNLPFLGLALVSSAAYAALAMRLVVGMFQRESVLFRT